MVFKEDVDDKLISLVLNFLKSFEMYAVHDEFPPLYLSLSS